MDNKVSCQTNIFPIICLNCDNLIMKKKIPFPLIILYENYATNFTKYSIKFTSTLKIWYENLQIRQIEISFGCITNRLPINTFSYSMFNAIQEKFSEVSEVQRISSSLT